MGCIVYYVYIYSALCKNNVNTFLTLFFTQAFVVVFDSSIFIPKLKAIKELTQWILFLLCVFLCSFINSLTFDYQQPLRKQSNMWGVIGSD